MYYAHIARPTNVSHQHPKKLALRIFIALGPGFSAIGSNENQQRFSARQILEYIAKTLRSVVDTGKPSKVRLDRAVRVYRSYAAYPNISTKIRGGPNEQDREQRGPQQRVQNCCNVAAGALHAAGFEQEIGHFGTPCQSTLLTRGLEPPRVAPYGPEPYASANSATRAKGRGKLLVASAGATPKSHRPRRFFRACCSNACAFRASPNERKRSA